LLSGGWGDYIAVSPDGSYVAAASTGRLYLWHSPSEAPEIRLLPGFNKSPIFWNSHENLIHAGVYKISLEPLTVIYPGFDIINLLSIELGRPVECLELDRAIWNSEGSTLYCQVMSVPSRGLDMTAGVESSDNASSVWFCSIDGRKGSLNQPPLESDSYYAISALTVNSGWLVTGDNIGLNVMPISTESALHRIDIGSQDQVIVRDVALSPEGKRVAFAALGGDVYIWNLMSGRLEQKLNLDCKQAPPCCLFEPRTGNLILSSGRKIYSWHISAQDDPTLEFETMDVVVGLAISETGNTLVSASGIGGSFIEGFRLI